MSELAFVTSDHELDYFAADALRYDQSDWPSAYARPALVHCVSGFRVPALPVAREVGLSPEQQLAQVLHRFVIFLRALHDPGRRGAIALHVVAHPERSTMGAEVGIYLLCRAAAESYVQAVSETDRLASHLYQLFPSESLFNYDVPLPLNETELHQVTFHHVNDSALHVVELRKFEDCLDPNPVTARFIDPGVDYIPHPFWSDRYLDPWLTLIETLAGQKQPAVLSLCLEPAVLVEQKPAAILAQQFRLIVEEGTRRIDLLDQASQVTQQPSRADRSLLQNMSLARAYRAQGITDFIVTRARRGVHTYDQLLAWQDQLFTMRVSLAADGPVPEALIQAVRAALSSPTPGVEGAGLGWLRPVALAAVETEEKAYALQNLRWLAHCDWGQSVAHPKLRRLRHLVTAQEAAGLFHLPIMPQAGQTSALSTADVPFVIPPEVASTRRFRPLDKPEDKALVSVGYLYQRGQRLAPELVGKGRALDFKLRLSDLEKPSLLVGAPGSGKSNLALHLLIQLWRDHGTPFLVLDPSTGHEYRYLCAEPSLHEDLIVYTLGDEEGLPFRFNPFEVPPGVTARGHITRLLACFKAAYEMWDPLPAIYEAALARVYSAPPYSWRLDDKGSSGRPCPCLADFAQAVVDELEEKVLPDYGKGTEASGILCHLAGYNAPGVRGHRGPALRAR